MALDLQSATTDDEKTAENSGKESQEVQSMAFVHQNLYQEDPVLLTFSNTFGNAYWIIYKYNL
ncbi:MAG: hypothetical protein IPI78_09550 [Chitinophagaceae bacterium]|nr:hypothetical protein [Chitinophagaceae bacterium]